MDKILGFGCMRLPMKGEEVDCDEFNKMIDYYIEQGFNYFDTAHGYLGGLSEKAIGDCLAKRYPRDKFVLANKLSASYFKKEEDIRPFFEKQLSICGVEYFDYYLMHAQDRNNYEQYKKCNAYQVGKQLKDEGKIKHLGLSFHDTADLLDKILTEQPDVEFVQIQFNYVDYDSPSVQGKAVYDVCRKHNKPIIVMEPVKGGKLVDLPDEAKKYFDELGNASYASYAVRFAADQEGVFKVLSGMSDFNQLKDNVDYMKDFKPLEEKEKDAIQKVLEVLNGKEEISCTACRYCVEGCPKKIDIPNLFSCYNTKMKLGGNNSKYYYDIYTKNNGKASDCIKCGKCEMICPQHLKIKELLEDVSKVFEK